MSEGREVLSVNANTQLARDYHDVTKHSPESVRMSRHRLDWANKPHPFKVYRGLPTTPLPRGFPEPSMNTIEAISSRADGERVLDLATLAQVLYFSAGITKKTVLPGGEEFYFRAAACAGALYPVEVYVVSDGVRDLPAGVYHFSPKEFTLTELRKGDFRPYLADAMHKDAEGCSVTIVLTGIFWRSAWKYQTRSYRYCFWDSGTILSNTLAVATAAGLRAEVAAGFIDERVDRLLGVDGKQEGTLCLVSIGRSAEVKAGGQQLPTLDVDAAPLTREEVEYPDIHRIHSASHLTSREEVGSWRGSLRRERLTPHGQTFHLTTSPEPSRPLGEVIRRRGSTRRFRLAPIGLDQLGSILVSSTQGFEADFLNGSETTLLDIYLIVNSVDDLPSGAYFFHQPPSSLEQLKEGLFRRTAGYLCLEQPLAAEASAVVFFLSDLRKVLRRFGNRGYRAAQLEAGVIGGRMYLAAYSLGLGATGLTFYDDEVTTFFEPHAQGKDAIFVVALGRAGKVKTSVVSLELPQVSVPRERA